MEVIKMRPSYYFTTSDKEILDEHLLALSSDEDTWLYKIESSRLSGRYEDLQRCSEQFREKSGSPAASGPLDSRTFTRRKRSSLRPSLEAVVESPLSNRSSLGLLNASKLLNSTREESVMSKGIQENPGTTFSNFTASDTNRTHPQRVFQLDSPFINAGSLGGVCFNNRTFDRVRVDSESSVLSIPLSLENVGPFEQSMSDSDIIGLLEQKEVRCQPPTAFQDECGMMSSLASDGGMTNSLISLPENSHANNALGFHEGSEQMTDSMVNFLAPVNFKPPRGFEDCEMSDSVMNMDDCDPLPNSEMTNSVIDYLNNVKINSPTKLSESTASSETENIPPIVNENKDGLSTNCADKTKASGDKRIEDLGQLNTTYELGKNGDFDLSHRVDEIVNLTYTNNINAIGRRKDDGEDDTNRTRTLNKTFEKELGVNNKAKALNNRDLNVTRDINAEEGKDPNSITVIPKETVPTKTNMTFLSNTKRTGTFTKSELSDAMRVRDLNVTRNINADDGKDPKESVPTKTNKTFLSNTEMNGTFTKSELNDALKSSRNIPLRESTFNTTFTKLQCHAARSTDGLNGMEDDQSSSASDSSFSSNSTKPRSVDELRSIAQLQEDSLTQQSTPTESSRSMQKPRWSIEFSPIRRPAGPGRDLNESRSANCSPVRDQQNARLTHIRPVSQVQMPLVNSRRLTLQASSLMNIARPEVSKLRMPEPISRLRMPRPSTAPAPAPATAIPRPRSMMSRLPMPRSRGTGIPGPKRTMHH